MARKKKGSIFADEEPGLDISSLIDVCFLLLIYFIVTTTIEASEQDINMKLPSQQPSSEKSVIEPMFIRVDADGGIYTGIGESREQLDSDPTVRDLPLLTQRLEIYKSAADLAGNQPVVQISVDGDSEQQRVLDTLNVLSKLGIKSVTFTDLID